jgi:hypothetical protein
MPKIDFLKNLPKLKMVEVCFESIQFKTVLDTLAQTDLSSIVWYCFDLMDYQNILDYVFNGIVSCSSSEQLAQGW